MTAAQSGLEGIVAFATELAEPDIPRSRVRGAAESTI